MIAEDRAGMVSTSRSANASGASGTAALVAFVCNCAVEETLRAVLSMIVGRAAAFIGGESKKIGGVGSLVGATHDFMIGNEDAGTANVLASETRPGATVLCTRSDFVFEPN